MQSLQAYSKFNLAEIKIACEEVHY